MPNKECTEVVDNVCREEQEEQCTTEQVEECNTVNDLQYESVVDEECEVETVCDTVETEECYTKHEKEWICEDTEEVEEKSDNRGEQPGVIIADPTPGPREQPYRGLNPWRWFWTTTTRCRR